ncbi:tetratricopeptide repeat protein [Dactylosporangium sp. CA-139114]|uniref:tetratricopeptide repeat protein n=1 Tax=Dactylosporangium sp. CA-139114 TaxID=3239931 RepID=UPI003D9533CA
MPQETPATQPRPDRIADRLGFARELSLLRDGAALTIRDVAARSGVPASTLGGYFAGTHLPGRSPAGQFERILAACGATDPAVVAQWLLGLRRARRGRPSAPPPAPPSVPSPAVRAAAAAELDHATDTPAVVSTRAPTERLNRQPGIRGRASLLARLERDLDQPRTGAPAARVHVLHGLGGSGKSTVALALARAAERRGVTVWWVSAVRPALFTTGMHAVAIDLGATPDELRVGSLPDQVWRRLAGHDRPWLLVVDDVDDPRAVLSLPGAEVTDGNGWLRPITGGHGAVVVTTRDGGGRTWAGGDPPWFELHPVPSLDAALGGQVLQELAGPGAGPADAARRLAHRLGGLPLALGIAGRYLGEVATMPPGLAGGGEVRTFDDYAAALDRAGPLRLLDEDEDEDAAGPGHGRTREIVGRTWELSLDLLAARGLPQARPVLRLLSCLRPAAVPPSLLRADVLAAHAPFAGLTPRRLWRAVRGLADVGLLDPGGDPAGETLLMHPLVREASRRNDDVDGDPDTYLAALVALLRAAVQDLDPKHPASWSTWSALAEHCGAPLDLIRDHRIAPPGTGPDVLEPALLAVRYLRAAGLSRRARAQAAALIAEAGPVVGRTDATVLALRNELGRSMYDTGEYNLAKRELHATLAARRRLLGPEHPDTMTTAHYLGRVLRDDGQLADAERVFREVLEQRRRVLGDEHLDTLTSLNNVGDVMRAQGRLDAAEQVLGHVLQARRRRLGADHPASLVTLFHLARLRRDRGELAAAEAEFEALAETSGRVLGEDHPRTLNALQGLADVRHGLGRAAEAEALTREVLARRARTLGPQHPATLVSRHRLALTRRDLGDAAAARAGLEEVLAARRRVLSRGHPATARAAADLGAPA